jgi:ribonucleoside-diphosphate reductase alpha chain
VSNNKKVSIQKTQSKTNGKKSGITFSRYFTQPGVHPYSEIQWEKRDAVIKNKSGESVFEQKDVEIPVNWSQNATNIVVQHYFKGRLNTPQRETSVKQIVDRVAKTIANFGRKDGYFASEDDAQIFEDELTHILVNQKMAFNSPVWYNIGLKHYSVEEKPQASACFILKIEDSIPSIMNLATIEALIFKHGSGSGVNLSPLRSSKEHLEGGGVPSGPVSFMKGFDAFAGVIKSGGKTRRAAKMVILNADHPDIVDFIGCKVNEEKKAHALIDAGYDGSLDGPVYTNIFFQNANNSVRVTDEFMKAVEEDRDWKTKAVTTGQVMDTYKARELMDKIAQASWDCGDPGMQFDTTVNKWNTVPNFDRINATNPCSEFSFVDNTSCNLASLNLMKFRKENGDFDVESYKRALEITITAQELLVSNAYYPTPEIAQRTHDLRPLGIGYTNLGALLMSMGLAYDSDEGRNFAAALTAMMSGVSYAQSARIAGEVGPFKHYKNNEQPFLKVINMHRAHAYMMDSKGVPMDVLEAARQSWDEAYQLGERHGYKNAQISVLAPTGTISFLMDCDTTGIEPAIALVSYKWLVGGGLMKLVNNTVTEALTKLGYDTKQKQEILDYLNKNDTIEGAPHLKDEHLPVFDCAFKAKNGKRSIVWQAHLKMMGATQPFISGAISKTVNMPADVSPKDVIDAYTMAWKSGLKAVAIYRDGCKRSQPLTTSVEEKKKQIVTIQPMRRKLQDERQSITHKFVVGGYEGYITVGLYEDGQPGEIFMNVSKEGSTLSGLMDAFAIMVSTSLQYGVPLKVLVKKFIHMRFEPSGMTNNKDIRFAKSIIDYIFRWMGMKFLSKEDQEEAGIVHNGIEPMNGNGHNQTRLTLEKSHEEDLVAKPQTRKEDVNQPSTFENQADAPACITCGSIMVRNGSCYKCMNCGATSGCS